MSLKKFISVVLGWCLGLFLADGVLSTLDDTINHQWDLRILSGVRGVVFLLSAVATLATYLLMGLTPMIPKRFFVPITLFGPFVWLVAIPPSIYYFDHISQLTWGISIGQLLLGLGVLARIRSGCGLSGPFIPDGRIGNRGFSLLNSFGFGAANLFLLAPCCAAYLAWCASLAVTHFTGGFLELSANKLSAVAKQYDRADGKTILLVPMMHIGEPSFYSQITASFPTNATVLMEGVTDRKKLLKHDLSYKRVASSLGLAEQKEAFEPTRGRLRPADVDVEQFSEMSIVFLNLATRAHSEGLTPELILEWLRQSQNPSLAKHLMDDLLTLRNDHLLKEIQSELSGSDKVVVPWGAAHMRGLSEGIIKAGFRETSTKDYPVLHYSTILRDWKLR